MSRHPRERDLRHDADSYRFGNAMLQCEGFGPECSERGRCQMDGRCFSHDAHLVAARMIEGLIPTGPHAVGVHFAYLRRCAEMLRSKGVHL